MPKDGTYKSKQKLGPGQVQVLIDGEWHVTGSSGTGTKAPAKRTTTGKAPAKTTKTTLPPANPQFNDFSSTGAGVSIPANIRKQFKLGAKAKLLYTPLPGSSTTVTGSVTPSDGLALFNAIKQSLPPKAAAALIKQWYGSADFNPEGKDATKVYNRVYQTVTDVSKYYGNTNKLTDFEKTGAQQSIAGIPFSNPVLPRAVVEQNQSTAIGQQEFEQSQRQQAKEFNVGQSQQAQATAEADAISQEGITVGLSEATASQQASAFGVVSNYLETWGLQDDASIVHQMIMKAGDHVTDTDAILNAIRGNSVSGLGSAADAALKRNYNAAFAGLEAYNRQPGAIHMTETQYQTYTQAIMNESTQYGAPMPSQKDIGELLNGHVSAVEYGERVTDIYAQVSNADPAVKAALAEEYGVNEKNLFAYFANPKNALQTMQRQVAGAEIDDYGNRVGLNGLNTNQTNQLADMAKLAGTAGNQGLGYGIGQIEGSLLSASKDTALTHAAPGADSNTVNNSQLIGSQLAGFDGTNQVAAETQVMRAEGAKAAPFEKGGGYAEDAKGVVGLGSART
jgi:hypothetical protein